MVSANEIENVFPPAEGDSKLMSIADLARELQSRGIVNRHRNTLRRWSEDGVMIGENLIRMKTYKIMGVRHSSVAWFYEFLHSQGE